MQGNLPPQAPLLAEPRLVYGLGRSGRGVLRFLHRHHLSADWQDARPSAEDLALTDALSFQRASGLNYRSVIAAPGVPIDHPDLETLRAGGAEILGEAELAYRFFPQLPLVGVTGTAGKGSTTILTAVLLRASGLDAREGGNIDPPLLDVVEGAQVAVAELSSFQLERVSRFAPRVAVITNLGVDHLDRHRSVAAYHAAKLNITAAQTPADTLIIPQGLEVSTRARTLHFDPQRLSLTSGETVLEVCDLPQNLHPANAAAALLAAEALLNHLGKTPNLSDWARTLREARPMPGRFETVCCLRAADGTVNFINDSIATRTVAVEAALKRAPAPVVWLIGGRDKGADLAPLREAARGKVKLALAFGEDGPKFARELGLPAQIIGGAADPMPQAVAAAWEALRDTGGSVLLAPIGTSFDLYRDYAARGEAFAAAALALAREVDA